MDQPDSPRVIFWGRVKLSIPGFRGCGEGRTHAGAFPWECEPPHRSH
jgi:hypothetical protein